LSKQQIGVMGMAVMGKNLALNIESRGIRYLFIIEQLQKQRLLLRRTQIKIYIYKRL
jgi:6-phosphogluconate dehydrogenase